MTSKHTSNPRFGRYWQRNPEKGLVLLFFFISYLFTNAQITEDQISAVDQIFSKYNRTDMPGAAVAIVQEGDIIYQKGYGMADLERGISITPNTVFYAGSISKQFVAASALLLNERGLLDFESDVQKYLPNFRNYQQTISVRHLVHHLSGIKDYFQLFEESGINYLNQISTDEVFKLINSQEELDFVPGNQYQYSNSGYLLLAMIVEKVSGTTLANFIKREIFNRLEMDHSIFLDDIDQIVPNRAWGYQKHVEGGIKNMIMRFDLVGSGGLYTTVGDLYRWDQNFYRSKIGSSEFINDLLKTGKLNNGRDTGYAFAIRKDTFKGLSLIGHSGSLGGYRAQYLQFPDQEFSIIILSNLANCKPGELAHQIAQIFLANDFIRR